MPHSNPTRSHWFPHIPGVSKPRHGNRRGSMTGDHLYALVRPSAKLANGHRLSLLIPAALVGALCVYALGAVWQAPSSGLGDSSAGVLSIATFVAILVELVAVPGAVFRLARNPELRTSDNVLATLCGAAPIGLGIFLLAAMPWGLGLMQS